MSTNAEVVAALEAAKSALQSKCDDASGSTLNNLQTAIHNISQEIGAIEAKALDAADYVPSSDPFKQQTAEAKAFLGTLNALKNAFSAAAAVAGAIDSVIKLIGKLGL